MYKYATIDDLGNLKYSYDFIRNDYISKDINTLKDLSREDLKNLIEENKVIINCEPTEAGYYEAACYTEHGNYTQVDGILGWGTRNTESIKMYITLDTKKPTRYYTTVGSPFADWMINNQYPYIRESCRLVGTVEIDGETFENYEFAPPELELVHDD